MKCAKCGKQKRQRKGKDFTVGYDKEIWVCQICLSNKNIYTP